MEEKNILISSLSLLNITAGRLSKYKKEKNECEGFMTNEAPIKLLLKEITCLDEIIFIVSDIVSNKRLYVKDEELEKIASLKDKEEIKDIVVREADYRNFIKVCDNEFIEEKDYQNIRNLCYKERKCNGKTTLEYLENCLKEYCTKNEIKNSIIENGKYKKVDIADEPSDQQVVHAVNEVKEYIEKIADENSNVNIYIESNGGIRYVTVMLINIMNVMERNYKNVHLKDIYSMVYMKSPTEVRNTYTTYASAQLLSSVDEFINYGKINSLKSYFNKRLETEENIEIKNSIQDCMNKLEAISEDLQLCRTEYIINHFYGQGNIYEKLNEFIDDYGNKEKVNANVVIFKMVIDVILKEYIIIYPENWENEKKQGKYISGISNIIRWCINKDYIQQAVTFCSEILPRYFYETNILVAGEEFWTTIEKYRKHYAKEYYALVSFLRHNLWENNIQHSISNILTDLNISFDNKTKIMNNYRKFDFNLEIVEIKELNVLKELYYISTNKNFNDRKNKLGEWFNKYYGKERKKKISFKISKKEEITYDQIVTSTYKGDDLFSYIVSNRKFINNLIRNFKGVKVSDKTKHMLGKLAKNVNGDEKEFINYVFKEMKWYYDYTTYIDNVNVKINTKDQELLNYVFGLYGVLKEQRNMANHANLSEEDKVIALKPEQLKCVVEELLDSLDKINSINKK